MNDFTPARPMGWRAEALAEGTTPQAVLVERITAKGLRASAYARELVIIPPHDGQPARFVITNLKSGHVECYELPEGVHLVAESTNVAEPWCNHDAPAIDPVTGRCECGELVPGRPEREG